MGALPARAAVFRPRVMPRRQKKSPAKGPGSGDRRGEWAAGSAAFAWTRYCTFKVTSSSTNEVCAELSSVPVNLIVTVWPI